MGYTLEAVIGPATAIRTAARGRPGAVFVPLPQRLAMVPMTDELFDSVHDGTSEKPLGFWGMPGGFDAVLSAWSAEGPVAYVEADFFGGVGSQRAALWRDGHLAVGPLSVKASEPFPAAGSPMSRVLRHLGVARGTHHDEFDAVGLGRHRETADWLPLATD